MYIYNRYLPSQQIVVQFMTVLGHLLVIFILHHIGVPEEADQSNQIQNHNVLANSRVQW